MTKVLAWEEKAAAAGSVDACAKLGDRYANGKGTAQDLHKAYDYLQKAAASGEARHQYSFGAFLLQNKELKPSAKKDMFEAFSQRQSKAMKSPFYKSRDATTGPSVRRELYGSHRLVPEDL